jgi:hypothetical protein
VLILSSKEVFLERERPGHLDAEETRRVLQRAAELDREHASSAGPAFDRAGDEPRLDAAELERIAAESGLSREALRRALDELGGGALPAKREKPRGIERLVAGESAVAEASFEETPEVVERRLSSTLRESGLEPVRRAAHATRWEPAAGLRHALGRAFDWRGTSAWIGSAVETSVYAVPGQRSSAQLRGDARDMFSPIALLTGLLLAFPAGFALLVVLAVGARSGFSPQHALAALLIIAAWMALTALISRGVARRRVRKLRRALERVLAQLTDGAPARKV